MSVECPKCLKALHPVGKFWICPEHGQIEIDAHAESSIAPETTTASGTANPLPRLGDKVHAPLNIFLSYGHDEYAREAERLKADLEKRGHTVWFDQERLKSGHDWELYIEEALRHCDHVVLLMTPYSVRRPDGYCLNEIAKALENRKIIIPVLLVELTGGAPVSISRLQYLDLRDGIPSVERPERYEIGFHRLIQALEENDLDFEGEQSRLLRLLDPLDFRSDIAPHLTRFTGRQWLFQKLDDWLANQSTSRIFWIVGGPGVGKSAIAARLSHRRDVRAIHFCVHSNSDKSDARRAVLSLAYQLSQQFPEYGRKLSQLHLESEQAKDASTLFDNLIVRLLGGNDIPTPPQPQLIVIDALDEATRDGQNELVDFIANFWSKTPPWLKLVITSRPELAVTSRLHRSDLSPFVLDARQDKHLIDLRSYLETGLVALGLIVSPEGIDTIVIRSQGIFLYVVTILDELRHRRLTPDRLDEFPQGMAGHYRGFFERQFPHPTEYEVQLLPVLNAIVAQREPLPLDLLGKTTGLASGELRSRLARLGSLFPILRGEFQLAADTISPFHKSILDWLTGLDEQNRLPLAGVYAVDREAGERMLAEACWGIYLRSPAELPPYVLRALPEHLCADGRWDDAVSVMTDLRYLGARVLAGQTHELVVEMEALELRLTADQLKNQLLPWLYFIRSNASVLSEHTSYFFQQAYNEPTRSPVSQSAQRLWEIACLDAESASSRTNRLLPSAFLEWSNRPQVWEYPACQMTLCGHSDHISCVTMSRDGLTIVSASWDKSIKVWDARTGICRATLDVHSDAVFSVAMSGDGLTMASGSYDRTVRIWDVETCQCLATLKMESPVASVALSWDGSTVVCALVCNIAVCDVRTGEVRTYLSGHTNQINSVALSEDGLVVISGGNDSFVKVWDAQSGTCRMTLKHKNLVSCVALSRDGKTIASRSSCGESLEIWDAQTGLCRTTIQEAGWGSGVALSLDGSTVVSGSYRSVKIFETRTGNCRTTLTGHGGNVTSVSMSEDGARILSASYDGTVKVWDTQLGICRSTLDTHQGPIWCVALSKDGSTVVTGAENGNSIKVWDSRMEACRSTLNLETDDQEQFNRVNCVGVSDDGSTIISTYAYGNGKIWDVPSGLCRATLDGNTNNVWSLKTFAGGASFYTISHERQQLKVWDTQSGACRANFTGHSERIWMAALSADGSTFANFTSNCATVSVWDVQTGFPLATLYGFPHGHSTNVTNVAISSDGSSIVSAALDGTVKVWDVKTEVCRTTLDLQRGGVTGVAMSGDGATIVVSGSDKTVTVWDACTGKCRVILEGHTQICFSVAISWDGSTVISGSDDQTVKVWDTRTGACRRTLHGHTDGVVSIALSRDGSTIASGSDDRTVRVWETNSGMCRATLIGHTLGIQSIALSQNGSIVVSGAEDRTVRVWDTRNGVCVATLEGHTAGVWTVAILANESSVVSISKHGQLKRWDISPSECRATVETYTDPIDCAAISIDGLTIVSGSKSVANVWNANTGEWRGGLSAHTNQIKCLAVSADGSTIVTGSDDGLLRVWDAKTKTVHGTLEGHSGGIVCVAIALDGAKIVSSDDKKTVKVWDAQTGECLATLNEHSAEAAVAWQSVGAAKEIYSLKKDAGKFNVPLFEGIPLLFGFGAFTHAIGPLVDDKMIAFNMAGEAFWFCIRRRSCKVPRLPLTG